jgi:hypothetical protein
MASDIEVVEGRRQTERAKMPLAFQLDHARRRVVTVATDPVTCSEVEAHLNALTAAGAAHYPELVDARGVTVAPAVRLAEVMRAGRWLRDRPTGPLPGQLAVVADIAVTYGVTCQLSVFAGPEVAVRPFGDAASAAAWLGWI